MLAPLEGMETGPPASGGRPGTLWKVLAPLEGMETTVPVATSPSPGTWKVVAPVEGMETAAGATRACTPVLSGKCLPRSRGWKQPHHDGLVAKLHASKWVAP